MNSIFNSPFELSLRILILMKTRNSRVTVEWLSCLDFVTTYGKDFGVSEFNLHGDNEYRFSEYAAKREVIGIAIKELVLRGFVNPHCNKSGFNYSITSSGLKLCETLNDEYAENYEKIAEKAISYFADYSERKLSNCINEKAILALGGK